MLHLGVNDGQPCLVRRCLGGRLLLFVDQLPLGERRLLACGTLGGGRRGRASLLVAWRWRRRDGDRGSRQLLDERAVKQIEDCTPLLRRLFDASTDKFLTQAAVLKGVGDLVTGEKHGAALIKKVPLILMALYDIDMLEEAVVLKWHARPSSDDAGRKFRQAAEPFIEWLRNAEEEEEEDTADAPPCPVE